MRKYIVKSFFCLALATLAFLPILKSPLQVQAEKIQGTPTGYDKAGDVEYQFGYCEKLKKDYLANWGARGEVSTFLSPRAADFYKDYAPYETLSEKAGGTWETAPKSDLYKSLQSTMKTKHTYVIGYQTTRWLYCFTDCQRNDYEEITSFYSGATLSGTWDSGATWNREHTWPNSKGLGGSDEDDIMMLRPTATSENSDRDNLAYGESRGFYDPGESVRGDCARIVLYVYTRWGNTANMWGSSGVMENLETLLRWMEEDPVDTWEMGRNDAVQYITGTRNVFVDYPEYAWLLFNEEIPADMITPSLNERASKPVTPPADTETDDPVAPPADTEQNEPVTSNEGVITLPACTGAIGGAWTAVLALGICLPAFKKKR